MTSVDHCRDMTTTTVAPGRGHRTSSLTYAAGTLFVVVPLLVEFVTGDAFLLMGLALLLLLAALPGLHRLQDGRDGRLGAWGVRATIAGLLGMVVAIVAGEIVDVGEVAWLALAGVSALSALIGVIAFSVGLTRATVLDASGIWAFLGGMTLGLASESFEQSLDGSVPWLADLMPPLGFVVAGVGLVLLGTSARRVEG